MSKDIYLSELTNIVLSEFSMLLCSQWGSIIHFYVTQFAAKEKKVAYVSFLQWSCSSLIHVAFLYIPYHFIQTPYCEDEYMSLLIFFPFFEGVQHGAHPLSSLARDQTHAPEVEARSFNHWTTMQSLLITPFNPLGFLFLYL